MHVSHTSDVTHPFNPTWRDYILLTKPQDVLLLMLVTLTTLLIAGENVPSLSILLATMVGSCLSGAGAGALNSYLDRDIDALMPRTRNRPLPAGRIEPRQALRFGIALCVLSLFVLGLGVNLLAATIAFIGIIVYVVIYTYWLKRRSMANIFFAGAAWAIPSLVGWAASTGSLTISAVSLFAILFYWTPINLWALGLVRLADYTRVGLPTLPVIKGSLTTRKQLVYYSILMIFLTLLPALIGLTDFIYAEAALLLGGVLVFNAFDLFRHPGISGASRLHKYSIVYLVLLFAAMMLDRTILN